MKKMTFHSMLTCLAFFFWIGTIGAQFTPVRTNAGIDGFQFLGACNTDGTGEQYRMLNNVTGAAASAIWNDTPLDLNQGFISSFQITFSPQTDAFNTLGADGFAFVLHNGPINTIIGSTGGHLGYNLLNTTANSLAVEFDIFPNANLGDLTPTGATLRLDHTALVFNEDMVNPIQGPTSIGTDGNIEDGVPHDVVVIWDPCIPSFTVDVDHIRVINYQGDIITDAFAGNPNVNWGITAGKASAASNHDICVDPIVISPLCNCDATLVEFGHGDECNNTADSFDPLNIWRCN